MMVRVGKQLAAGLIALVVVMTAGVAWAAWTANGSGGSGARAMTAQTVTVTATTGTADLYPGFAGGDVHFSLTNTNPYDIDLTSMTPGSITSSSPAACPSSNLTVVPASGLTLSVNANSSSGSLSIVDVATLALAAPNGCQGVTFTVTLNLTGSQV